MVKLTEALPDIASQKRCLNMRQVRALFGVSRSTIIRWMNRKQDPLPSVRFGPNSWPKFPLDKVLWWKDNHEVFND